MVLRPWGAYIGGAEVALALSTGVQTRKWSDAAEGTPNICRAAAVGCRKGMKY